MNDSLHDQGATLVLDLFSMPPWPPRTTLVVGAFETPVGLVTVAISPEPKLSVSVDAGDGRTGVANTGTLRIPQGQTFKVALSCTPALEFSVFAGGQQVGRSNDGVLEAATFDLEPAARLELSEDLIMRSREAPRERAESLSIRSPRAGRTQMPLSYAVDGLRREIAQVGDLIDACHRGGLHHVYGLAARLRLLVARGRNAHPLLQSVAAPRGVALPVHALPASELTDPGVSMIGAWSLRDRAEEGTATVDLDVWLDQPGAIVAGNPYSNNGIIRAIADTVGAHFDPELEPLVGMLERMQSRTEAGLLSELERWVINTSACIRSLSVDTLQAVELTERNLPDGPNGIA